MGASTSKQGGRKLAKSVSESAAKTINRTSNVNQLPLQNLRDKFEQQHKDNLVSQGDEKSHQDEISQHSFRPDSTTKFDPKFLRKKLNNETTSAFEGKDGGDPHEQGTSTYDKSFIDSVSKLGTQIKTIEFDPYKDKNALPLRQLRSRKKLYDLGEQELKDLMEPTSLLNEVEKTMVHPQTLSAILRDLDDPRVDNKEIHKDYQLEPDFLKKLGTSIRLPKTTVVIEEVVKKDEVGHKKVVPRKRHEEAEIIEDDHGLEKDQYDKLKKRLSLDD